MTPDWLQKAIDQARAEGRILSDTGVRPGSLAPSAMAGEAMLEGASEEEFQGMVITYAQDRGWKVAHFRPARTFDQDGRPSWATPVAADGKGFLDLELVRERMVKAELKVPPNKMTAEQEVWFKLYQAIGQEVYCWYPADWKLIKQTLV